MTNWGLASHSNKTTYGALLRLCPSRKAEFYTPTLGWRLPTYELEGPQEGHAGHYCCLHVIFMKKPGHWPSRERSNTLQEPSGCLASQDSGSMTNVSNQQLEWGEFELLVFDPSLQTYRWPGNIICPAAFRLLDALQIYMAGPSWKRGWQGNEVIEKLWRRGLGHQGVSKPIWKTRAASLPPS